MGACSHKDINRRIYRANARPRCSVAKSRLALRYKYIAYHKVHVSKRKMPRNRKVSGVFLLTGKVERLNDYFSVERNRSGEMVMFGNINAYVNIHEVVPPFPKV